MEEILIKGKSAMEGRVYKERNDTVPRKEISRKEEKISRKEGCQERKEIPRKEGNIPRKE
jgi:hypothetical protein